MVGGALPRILQTLLAAPLTALLEKKRMAVLVHKPNHDDQLVWKALIEAGQITPVVVRKYSLEDAAQALLYFGEGRAKGKVVVCMEPPMASR
ncbi:zinc-binding dehydrogenase [Paenibacillus alginolyticus]|uniref:Zinc-binding dehydrogenase n=1 Tax=Paenibacillus alginolyticus TaxID=59839 RepID=A0ABT4GHB0_9BACL|nr:zinc-binding dehydrogenase [Paenibacillus alginolyticus]MCY9695511.1 zinc-binding dehydrogenase [Paenibacillus alginolyticus]MEC0147926.1 zinc-binding dehydrogenase [Paenibacillus alginolyticus]